MRLKFIYLWMFYLYQIDADSDVTKDLIFVYDKIDQTISFDDFTSIIKTTQASLFLSSTKTFQNFMLVVPTRTDILVEAVNTSDAFFTKLKKLKRLESPIKALHKALQISSKNSLIFVFSDSEPEDTSSYSEILDAIEEKKIEVGFFLGASRFKDGIPEEYRNISYTSNGVIFDAVTQVPNSLVTLLYRYVNKVNLLTIDCSHSNLHKIAIDEYIHEITLASFNDRTRILTHSSLIEFYKSLRESTTSKGKASIMEILGTPPAGQMTVTSSPTRTTHSYFYTLRVFGVSHFNFVYGFSSERVDSMDKTSIRPILDTANYLYIAPSNNVYNADFKSCQLVSSNGTILDEFPLREKDANFYFGLFEPSIKTYFYLRVNASIGGKPVQRMSSNAIRPIERPSEAKKVKAYCATFKECVIWYSIFYASFGVLILIAFIFAFAKNKCKKSYDSVETTEMQ